jgi:WD40 repeat protein
VVDILHSRVADDPDWGPQVTALRDVCPRPRLVNRWLLPDLADLALQRVLTGHADTVNAVAVAPDGSWLASGGSDGTLRIWDVATGRERVPLAAARDVTAVAVAPDGSWLVSGGSDGTVRIWDVATSRERATLTDQAGRVTAVAVAPDSAWLAVGGGDGTVRIWDVATLKTRAQMRVDGSVNASVWLGSDALAVGGSAGLYLFSFLTGLAATAH